MGPMVLASPKSWPRSGRLVAVATPRQRRPSLAHCFCCRHGRQAAGVISELRPPRTAPGAPSSPLWSLREITSEVSRPRCRLDLS